MPEQLRIDEIEKLKESQQYLPTVTVVRSVLFKFLNERGPYSLKRDPALVISLGVIQSLFGGFLKEYEKYLTDPDEGVIILSDRDTSSDKWRKYYKQPVRPMKREVAEGLFISVIILLSILKPFSDFKHAVHVRRKRYNDIIEMIGSLLTNHEGTYIGVITMQDLAYRFLSLPKLKASILSAIVATVKSAIIEPIQSYLLKILIHPKMKMFIIIDYFLGTAEKTKAHNNWAVQSEIDNYMHARSTLKERFEDIYYFAQVMDQNITDATVYKWPCLGAAALTFANIKYPKIKNLDIFGLSDIDFSRLVLRKADSECLNLFNNDFNDASLFLDAMYGESA